MLKMKIDPAKYEIFYHKLDQILDEGKEVVRYLSGSTITREAGEVLQAYYNLDGQAADLACGILVHVLNVTRCIKYMTDENYAGTVGIKDGDIFINNDAHIGGAHVPDTAVLMPFFYKGEHLGYTAALSHTTEVGAIDPGGMCPRATEAYHDGLHLPCVKLGENGNVRADIMNMILRSTRDARGTELDVRARIAGCVRTERRLKELVDEVGVDFFRAATAKMVEDAALEARSKIKMLRPGVYSSRIYVDNGGLGNDKVAIVHMDMEVTEDGELRFNFPIVSPQTMGSNNCYTPLMESALLVTLLERLFYDLRWNTGVAIPTKLDIIPHSRISADANLSVGMGIANLAGPATSPLDECLSRAFYVSGKQDEVEAPANNGAMTMLLAGVDIFDKPCVNMMMSVAGQQASGGRMHKDGIDSSVTRYNPWSYTSDAESEESLSPALWLTQSHLPDSGGFGKYRGGISTYNMLMIHPKIKNAFSLGHGLGYKSAFSQGLFGGYPSAAPGYTICKDSDLPDRIEKGKPVPHEVEEIKKWIKERETRSWMYFLEPNLKGGDVLIQVGLPGSGLGDPIERPPELILEDIKNETGTIDVARRVYCVAIDPKTLEVDHSGTEKLREERRKLRLSQGIPGKEFLKGLVEKRRKRDLPEIALKFMDETIGFSPAYKEQLETEEKMLEMDLKPLGKVKAKKEILDLSPYVKIVEDEKGRKVQVCSNCGFGYCDASENFKLYSLIFERDPAELQVGFYSYDKDWCIYREFYCPSCGTQVEVEATAPGTPILHSVKLKDI